MGRPRKDPRQQIKKLKQALQNAEANQRGFIHRYDSVIKDLQSQLDKAKDIPAEVRLSAVKAAAEGMTAMAKALYAISQLVKSENGQKGGWV